MTEHGAHMPAMPSLREFPDLVLREATAADWQAIWPLFEEVARAGETYAFDTAIDEGRARNIWFTSPRKTFVATARGTVLGTYYLKTNFDGPGSHVCNCGYMVAPSARGKGLARLLCRHSQSVALELGYKAMQFNYVAASNSVAVALWEKLGYQIVGRLPRAFNHPSLGFTDALVMYKWLENQP